MTLKPAIAYKREKICPMTSARARVWRNVDLFRQRNQHYVQLAQENLYTMRVRVLSGRGSFTLNKFLILKVE